MTKYDGIIFDMDGTIWNSTEAVCKAWNETFLNLNITKRITPEELSGLMGLPMTEIGIRVFPNEEEQERERLLNLAMKNEVEYIAEHGAVLYPELINTLSELQKKVKLYIVSNCQTGYIEAFFKAHKTAGYFTDYECFGNTMKLKADNIKLIIKRNNIKTPVYIGDTQIDADSAEEASCDFIFASYGFGKVDNACCSISTFSDILKIIL